MRPKPAAFIAGTQACASCTAQPRWRSTSASRSSSFTSASSAGRITPALWITVSGAKRCATSSAACAVAARSIRSTSIECSCSCVNVRRAPRQRHHLPAVGQQLAADASPMPALPPVTTAMRLAVIAESPCPVTSTWRAGGRTHRANDRGSRLCRGRWSSPPEGGRPKAVTGWRHVATKASTRSGLPLPCSIFSGGQISTAPVGGSRSRLLRHCRP